MRHVLLATLLALVPACDNPVTEGSTSTSSGNDLPETCQSSNICPLLHGWCGTHNLCATLDVHRAARLAAAVCLEAQLERLAEPA